jgi:hypothetical protein
MGIVREHDEQEMAFEKKIVSRPNVTNQLKYVFSSDI